MLLADVEKPGSDVELYVRGLKRVLDQKMQYINSLTSALSFTCLIFLLFLDCHCGGGLFDDDRFLSFVPNVVFRSFCHPFPFSFQLLAGSGSLCSRFT